MALDSVLQNIARHIELNKEEETFFYLSLKSKRYQERHSF
jgi:hypothetical protein